MSLTEKYRPKSFDSKYLIKTKPIRVLEERVNIDREIPHLLFVGNAGVGKTTIAHILVRKVCNLTEEDRIGDYCLDLNASDESGIDTIRGKIKNYAKSRPLIGDKRYIFLDECDEMSYKAQPALRRIMEDYSDSCTFILSCNFPHKVIKPVKSRCALFKFPEPESSDVFDIVKIIVEEENIKITNDAIHEIIEQFDCDVRSVINFIDGHSANLLIEKSDIQIETKSQELVDLILDCKDIIVIRHYFRETKFDAHTTVSNMLEPIHKKLLDSPRYGDIVEKLADTVYRVNALSNTDGMMQLYNFCIWLYHIIKFTNDINIVNEVYSAEGIIDGEKDFGLLNKEIGIIEKEKPKKNILKVPTLEESKESVKEKSVWDELK